MGDLLTLRRTRPSKTHANGKTPNPRFSPNFRIEGWGPEANTVPLPPGVRRENKAQLPIDANGGLQFILRHVINRRALFFFCFAALVLLNPLSLPAAEVRPPFGLAWGEVPKKLEELLKGAGATITVKGKSGERDVWTVEGLLQPRLKRTLFYFASGSLSEVELQYEDSSWDVAQYDSFLGEVRGKVEQLYGPGTLIARQKAPTGDVTETVVGYQWKLENGSMQLFYFSAERPPNVFRTVSVHYKAQ